MLSLLILQAYILSQCHRYICDSDLRFPLRLLWKLSYPLLACVRTTRRERKQSGFSGKPTRMSLEEQFYAGVKVIQSLPKDGPYQPSYSSKLKFYSLFKQASNGPCKIGKPAFWDVVGRAKWEAWNKLGDISKEEAMSEYVEELKKIVLGLEKIVQDVPDVQDFLDSIGPFSEFINLQGEEMKHIKDQVDELTSSSKSGSSSTSTSNSAMCSPTHSVPNSPVIASHRSRLPPVTNIDTKESDTFKATTNSVTIHADSNGHLPNSKGEGECLLKNPDQSTSSTDQDFDQDSRGNNASPTTIPPPVSTDTIAKPLADGYAKCSSQVQDNEKNDEILEIRGNENVIEFTTNHQKLSGKFPTETEFESGADSEKYYSGDSEPDFEERSVSYNGNRGPGNCKISSGYQNFNKYNENSKVQLFKTHLNGSYQRVNEHIATGNHTGSDHVTATSSSYLDIAIANRSSNSEIVLHATVDRLNRDVEHILARLRILEAACTANAGGSMIERNYLGTKKKHRIFGELSTLSLILILTWPFAAHFLIKLITSWLRRRRIPRVLSITN